MESVTEAAEELSSVDGTEIESIPTAVLFFVFLRSIFPVLLNTDI